MKSNPDATAPSPRFGTGHPLPQRQSRTDLIPDLESPLYISTAATNSNGSVNEQKIPTGFSVAMAATNGSGTYLSEAAAHLAWKTDQFLHEGVADDLLPFYQLLVPVKPDMKESFEQMRAFYHDTEEKSQWEKFQEAFPKVEQDFAKSLEVGKNYFENACLVDYKADTNIGLVFTSISPSMKRSNDVDASVIVPLFRAINAGLAVVFGSDPKLVWVSFETNWHGALNLSIKRSNLAETENFHDCGRIANEIGKHPVLQAYHEMLVEMGLAVAQKFPDGGGHDFAAGAACVKLKIKQKLFQKLFVFNPGGIWPKAHIVQQTFLRSCMMHR